MNNKLLLLSLAFVGCMASAKAQVYASKAANLRFFSETPIENIEAVSNTTVGVLATDKNSLQFSVFIKSFVFDKALMQEHFNENYMESETYPKATFSGIVSGISDWSKEGTYDVTATGDLTIHGVTQKRTIPGKITISGESIVVESKFMVKCVDHKIEIPKIVIQKIAEEIEVSLNAKMLAFKK
jgi:polyisoprenoid-binding protein YceI